MNASKLKIVLISTPIGFVGSGRGGGVELTMSSLIQGLLGLGHEVILVAPEGSILPKDCLGATLVSVKGIDQPSWQHQKRFSPVVIPHNGVLPRLLEKALEIGRSADAVINFSYDWLPLWITKNIAVDLFHLISMGAVSEVMKSVIEDLSKTKHSRLAFHTHRQASDYLLSKAPEVVGNGFDLKKYDFQPKGDGPLGWAGRIAPEKGLEDAVAVAGSMNDRLLVWGVIEDSSYAEFIEASAPKHTIDWRGFLPTDELQKQLGTCRAFLNTPKWNEAYGNVVVEAMACGVPVIAYDRGGPGEIINSGETGWLVTPDDVEEMINLTLKVHEIDRKNCREWVEEFASQNSFALRIVNWINAGIAENKLKNK